MQPLILNFIWDGLKLIVCFTYVINFSIITRLSGRVAFISLCSSFDSSDNCEMSSSDRFMLFCHSGWKIESHTVNSQLCFMKAKEMIKGRCYLQTSLIYFPENDAILQAGR